MQKTLTAALIDKLNAECKRMCRCGKCNMECDAHGAHIGWCKDVWELVGGGKHDAARSV